MQTKQIIYVSTLNLEGKPDKLRGAIQAFLPL